LISSTLSVFLKLTLGFPRCVLAHPFRVFIGAVAAPMVGTLIDRHGAKWLMAAGGVVSGLGFLLLGQTRDFSCIAL
jgi:hypothetical protein